MQRKFIYMLGFLICLSLLAGPVISASDNTASTTATAETGIKWISYTDGIKKIKEENKKGFLHFYTDWCTYCKIMNKNTFADKAVIDYLNENFVPIRVNAEKERDPAKKYNVDRFPTNFFIAGDGSTIGNRPGYIPPDMMLNMLKYIKTDSYKSISFSDFLAKKN